MLRFFRGMLEGPGKWVFIILLCAAFGVFGVPALENFGSTSAIKVGRQDISARDVELEIRNQMRAIQEQNPGVSRDQALAQGLGDQVIQTMITRALLEDEADRLGLAAPGPVVQEYLGTIEGLTDPDTGRIDQQRLSFFLSQNGLSLQGFRDLIADELVRQQIAETIGQPIAAPEEMTRLLLLRGVERRQVRFATIPLDAASVDLSDEDIQAYYDANLDSFQSPEYRVLTFLTVDDGDIAEGVEVSEDDVRQLFDARQGQAAASETRTVRQLRVGADNTEQAQGLVDEGADLDTVAEAVGGTVTVVENQTRGGFINEEIGEAAFEAEEGSVAGPVETPFGTVFLEVTAINRTEGPSFEDEREALEAELRAEIAAERVAELVEAVELARDEGASLSEAAESAGLTAQQTQPLDQELFTRTGAIATIPASLAREGFSLGEGQESSAVPVGTGYGFVAVDQVIAPSPRALDEVRNEVENALRAERRRTAADTIETQFEEAITGGQTFTSAAESLGGEARSVSVSVQDEDSDLPQVALQQAFQLPVGERAVVPAGAQPSVYVVEVADVSFEGAAANQQYIPLLAQQFGQQISGELAQAYIEALEASTDVKQNPRQLARALGQEQ